MKPPFAPVGVDVSKTTIDLEVYEPSSKCKHGKRLQFSNDAAGFAQCEAWLKMEGACGVHACLEATGTYSDAFALFLFEQGHQVSIINPARVAAFRKSEGVTTKTDRHDAWLLARLCAQEQPALWHPTPAEIAQLQVLLTRREQLEHMRQQEHNRLENGRLDEQSRQEIGEHLDYLQGQLDRLHQRLEQHVHAHASLQETCEVIDSIPGIGRLSAMRLASVFSDQQQFPTASQVVAYAGGLSQ